MKMEVLRYKIRIIPECATDEAFIEEVLKLKKDDDSCTCRRSNVMNLDKIAHLNIEKE